MGKRKKINRLPGGRGSYTIDERNRYCWMRRFGASGPGQKRVRVRCADYETFLSRVDEALQEIRKVGSAAATRGAKDSVASMLRSWLAMYVKPVLAGKTYDSYEERCRVSIVPHLGARRVSQLGGADVQTMINSMLASREPRYAPRTIIYTVSVLSRALRKMGEAARWVAISEDITLPQGDPPRSRVLSNAEIELVLEALKKFRIKRQCRRDEPLITLLLNTMVRKCEALGIRYPDDVNLEERTLRINKQIVFLRGLDAEGCRRWEYKYPKGDAEYAVRTIRLNDDAVNAIRRQVTQIAGDKLRAGSGYKDSGLLFATESGRPVSPRNVLRTLVDAEAAINLERRKKKLPPIEHFTVHDLRRTGLTHLAKIEKRAHVVGAVAGHAKGSRTTAKVYVWADQELQDGAMEQLRMGKAAKEPEVPLAEESYPYPTLDLG